MGSWNGTCAVTNMHVHSGQDVVVFMLLENHRKKSFCYENALYDVCPIPFYGEYNDYGAVENCHGFGLPIVVEEIKKQLYEFGSGPNKYHDPAVRKADFNIDVLFDADHEDRLGIEGFDRWNQDDYDISELERVRDESGLSESQQFELDRLAAKIKKVDTFRRVTHVIIHGVAFRNITEKWFLEEYVGENKGDRGYNNSYRHIYFKDLINSIPEYVESRKMEMEAEVADLSEEDTNNPSIIALKRLMRRYGSSNHDDWNSPNLARKWMARFNSSSSDVFGLVSVREYVDNYMDARDWDGLAAFLKEVFTGAWINTFMSATRKVWTKQTGMGSQSQEEDGYLMIAQTIHDIIENDRKRFGDEDEDDEEDEDESVDTVPATGDGL